MTTQVNTNILPFDGLSKQWTQWKTKYLARATISGYKKVLIGKIKPPAFAIDDDLCS